MAAVDTLALQEEEMWEHSAEFESGEEEAAAKSVESSGTQPSVEAAGKVDRMLSSASTDAAAWFPPTLDDTLWGEDDDDEGFSGWTPWTPASFKMTEDKSSGTPSAMPVDITSQ
jgi:hypothetical protein